MEQQSEQPVKAEQLVRKLKPWWGIAIAGLFALGEWVARSPSITRGSSRLQRRS
jgi:hypothetical protein